MQQKSKERQAEYAELLKKPQWQKRRLQMLEKADWKCVECGAEERQLHVHHRRYIAGAMPWEYADEDLAVLCEQCHDKAHGIEPAKTRKPRRPPTAVGSLLRVALQRPAAAIGFDASVVPTDTEEGRALAALIATIEKDIDAAASGIGSVIERFRGTEHEEVIARAAAGLVDAEFDDAAAAQSFAGAARKFRSDSVSSRIAALLQRDRVAGLAPGEKAELSKLLLEKRQLCGMTDQEEQDEKEHSDAQRRNASDAAMLDLLRLLRSKSATSGGDRDA